MLTSVPLAISLDFDAGAVDKQVHRFGGWPTGNHDVERLLATAQRAVIGNRPSQTRQLQQAFHKTRRLPQSHTENHPGSSPGQALQRQTSLDRSIAVRLLATALA